jgi:5,5'-dehydrodivanillate O-demethylase
MLSAKDNEALTRVGRGTPMGELMRRYWQPVAAVAQLDEQPTLPVRLLGEDLVLYRDTRGGYGRSTATARTAGPT